MQPYPYEGLGISYLRLLEDHTGFRCKSVSLYEADDVGFDRFIEEMTNCSKASKSNATSPCNCDIGAAGWFETAARGHVDFLPPYVEDELRVVVHIDDISTRNNTLFFISCFTPGVWICVAFLVAMFTNLRLLDRSYYLNHNYIPLPASTPFLNRLRHFLLKKRVLFRLRKSFITTCAFFTSLNRVFQQLF